MAKPVLRPDGGLNDLLAGQVQNTTNRLLGPFGDAQFYQDLLSNVQSLPSDLVRGIGTATTGAPADIGAAIFNASPGSSMPSLSGGPNKLLQIDQPVGGSESQNKMLEDAGLLSPRQSGSEAREAFLGLLDPSVLAAKGAAMSAKVAPLMFGAINKLPETENIFSLALKRKLKDTSVIDEKGEPLLVYRGQRGQFEDGRGFSFWTPDLKAAHEYAGTTPEGSRMGSNIMAAHLNIKKPFELTTDAAARQLAKMTDKSWDTSKPYWDLIDQDTIDALREAKYDGIKLSDATGEINHVSYVPIDSDNIIHKHGK